MTTTIADVWDSPDRHYPFIIYIETTNLCNAHCVCCPVDRVKKPRGTMSLDSFKQIVDKIKPTGKQIGAMFCFGEPLIDPTLFEKYKYAREQGVLPGHVGFNTNVSLLTPDRYEGIFTQTPNITLSFFNTYAEYEKLTGLSFDKSYNNAITFIKYRDAHYPGYPIFIGVNPIPGSSLESVKSVFARYNVTFVQDAYITVADKVITGPLNRHTMFRQNHLGCDGYKGAMQIKFNGECGYCAYDIMGDKIGGETRFANIFTDSWEDIEHKFKEKFKSCSSLCARCEYWYHAKEVLSNDYNKPNPLPNDWYDWQKPFLSEGEAFHE